MLEVGERGRGVQKYAKNFSKSGLRSMLKVAKYNGSDNVPIWRLNDIL